MVVPFRQSIVGQEVIGKNARADLDALSNLFFNCEHSCVWNDTSPDLAAPLDHSEYRSLDIRRAASCAGSPLAKVFIFVFSADVGFVGLNDAEQLPASLLHGLA